MRLLKKRGIVFHPTMVLVAVVVLMYAFSTLDELKKEQTGSSERNIGSTQSELFKTYQTAEQALFYIDQSAQAAARQSAVEFTTSAALSTAECGTVIAAEKTYIKWNAPAQECFPVNPYPAFEKIFTKNLDSYLNQYTHPIITFPKENYALTLTKTNIIGTAIQDLQLDLKGTSDEWIGRYYTNPSFTIDNPLNLETIKQTANTAKEIYLLCIDKECAKQEIIDRNLGWNVQEQGAALLVELPLGNSVWATGEDGYEYQPVILKFALDFS